MVKKRVMITGASGGIGRALAVEYAKRGHDLGLFARRVDKLEELAQTLRRAHGVRVELAALDVAEYATVAPAVDAMRDALGGLDVIIANAGITAVNRTGGGKVEVDAAVIRTNLLGGIATIDAAARHFRAEKRGQLVGVSSVSAYAPIPGSGAYSASKAGFSSYLGAARAELRKHGIAVATVHPGYVKTDITPGMEKYPFLVEAEVAAVEIVDALESGVENVIVPAFPWKALVPAMQVLPSRLLARIL